VKCRLFALLWIYLTHLSGEVLYFYCLYRAKFIDYSRNTFSVDNFCEDVDGCRWQSLQHQEPHNARMLQGAEDFHLLKLFIQLPLGGIVGQFARQPDLLASQDVAVVRGHLEDFAEGSAAKENFVDNFEAAAGRLD
jgi:hypothetical protein